MPKSTKNHCLVFFFVMFSGNVAKTSKLLTLIRIGWELAALSHTFGFWFYSKFTVWFTETRMLIQRLSKLVTPLSTNPVVYPSSNSNYVMAMSGDCLHIIMYIYIYKDMSISISLYLFISISLLLYISI